MKKAIYVLVFLTGSFLFGCEFNAKRKASQSNDSLVINEFEIKKGKKLDSKDWNCSVIEKDVICHPSKWKPVKQDKVYYFAYLNNNDKQTFFTIINYDVMASKISDKEYLKMGYAQLLADTTEKLEGYTVKQLIFADKTSYYAEYFTILNKKKYFTYSMVFEKDGLLYDISLKVERNDAPAYKTIFRDILFNMQVNGILIFDENDKLEKIHIVDLSKL